MSEAQVPVLITWDVDPDRWTSVERREQSLTLATDLCERFGVHATFFVTAQFAHEYQTQIDRLQGLGSEVGCHGLTHADEEDYNAMTPEMQRIYIEEATQKLQAVTGAPVTSFRSPRVKTSHHTLRLLADFGYRVDSSVCSQRIDFVSSNLINPGWIAAPRRPYHPHEKCAFKRGELSIWEVPVSAIVMPFISSFFRVSGIGLMKYFFKLLYAESQHTGKPVVYLAHPTEFIPCAKWKPERGLKDFSLQRIRTHGFLIRNMLYKLSGEELFEATRDLFAYMASFPGVNFMSCREYVDAFDGHKQLSAV